MQEDMQIPDHVKREIIEKLGVSESHILEALEVAQRSEFAGTTPFLSYITQAVSFFRERKEWKTFQHTQSNRLKLETVFTVLEQEGIHPPEFETRSDRSGGIAEENCDLREEGNTKFKKREFRSAITCYTAAALAAKTQTEKAMAIANRSAALFHVKEYQSCVEDCEAATLYGYPRDLEYKLWDRKGRCCLQLGQEQAGRESLELAVSLLKHSTITTEAQQKFKDGVMEILNNRKNSGNTETKSGQKTKSGETKHQAKTIQTKPGRVRQETPLTVTTCHAEISGLSSKVAVMYSEGKGRHCVAREEIAPGEVIMTDSPVAWFLSYNHLANQCYHCCSPLPEYVYPNPLESNFPAVFCSVNCGRSAQLTYLKYEEKISLEKLFRNSASNGYDEISGSVLLALRALLSQSPDLFALLPKDRNREHLTVKDGDRDSRIMALFHLEGHQESRTQPDLLSFTVKSYFLVKLLIRCGYLQSGVLEPSSLTMAEAAFSLLLAVQYNTHPIDQALGTIRTDTHVELEELGSAVYPLLATICNHSCDPSTLRVCVGREVVVVARRKLLAGEEVTDCYGFHYTSLDTSHRQKRIQRWYNFTCDCEACQNNFPQMGQLDNNSNNKVKEELDQMRRELERGDERAFTTVNTYLRNLDKLDYRRPHKVFEAGSHILSCCLWKFWGNHRLQNCKK